jgi:putative SOS response-associated peptidase YedK
MFRVLAQKRRCLIFADGFYEWQKVGRRKQPYFIRRADRQPMAFAGLWDTWEKQGDSIISSSIITTTASSQLAPIHDRMPFIMPPQLYADWLSSSAIPSQALQRCLMDASLDPLEFYAVSALVNTPVNNGPECIRPLV